MLVNCSENKYHENFKSAISQFFDKKDHWIKVFGKYSLKIIKYNVSVFAFIQITRNKMLMLASNQRSLQ